MTAVFPLVIRPGRRRSGLATPQSLAAAGILRPHGACRYRIRNGLDIELFWEKQKDLGQDHVKMKWYLLDYGVKDNVPSATQSFLQSVNLRSGEKIACISRLT